MNLGRIFLTFFTTEDKPHALWATLVEGQDAWYTDRSGRRHRVKARPQVPVMLALGVWPESGRTAILDCEMSDEPGEDRGSWLCLLTSLEACGLRPEGGLQLSVHDGCSALMAVLPDRGVHFNFRERWGSSQAAHVSKWRMNRSLKVAGRITVVVHAEVSLPLPGG